MRLKYAINSNIKLQYLKKNRQPVKISTSHQKGDIPLNGKLIFWGAVSCFCNIYKNNTNIWKYAKQICENIYSVNRVNAHRTRLYTFIVLNKVYGVQGICQYRLTNRNNAYCCFDDVSNDYYTFAIYINTGNTKRQIALIKAMSKVGGAMNGNNIFFVANYDIQNNLLNIDDPDIEKNTITIDYINNNKKEFKKKLISDFNDLHPINEIINGVNYKIVKSEDGYELGLSEKFLNEENCMFNVIQEESEVVMRDIYIKTPYDEVEL